MYPCAVVLTAESSRWRLAPVIVGQPVTVEAIVLGSTPCYRLTQGQRLVGYARTVAEIEKAGIDLAEIKIKKGGDAQ